MVVALFETAEDLTEREVPDDVKRGQIQPIGQVHSSFGGWITSRGSQLVHQQVYIVLYQRLMLLSQGTVRESMRQDPSLACMSSIVRGQDFSRPVDPEAVRKSQPISVQLILAVAPSSIHDLVPGIRMDVGDTFRACAYDVAILFVKGTYVPMTATANDAQLEGDAGYGPELWAGNLGQRVVGDVVDPC